MSRYSGATPSCRPHIQRAQGVHPRCLLVSCQRRIQARISAHKAEALLDSKPYVIAHSHHGVSNGMHLCMTHAHKAHVHPR